MCLRFLVMNLFTVVLLLNCKQKTTAKLASEKPPGGEENLLIQLLQQYGNGTVPRSLDQWDKVFKAAGPTDHTIVIFSRAPEYTNVEAPRFLFAAKVLDNTSKFAGRVFVGSNLKTGVTEFIAWNPQQAGYDFGLVEGGNLKPAKREDCVACHKNQGPIFPKRGWPGTTAFPLVAYAFIEHLYTTTEEPKEKVRFKDLLTQLNDHANGYEAYVRSESKKPPLSRIKYEIDKIGPAVAKSSSPGVDDHMRLFGAALAGSADATSFDATVRIGEELTVPQQVIKILYQKNPDVAAKLAQQLIKRGLCLAMLNSDVFKGNTKDPNGIFECKEQMLTEIKKTFDSVAPGLPEMFRFTSVVAPANPMGGVNGDGRLLSPDPYASILDEQGGQTNLGAIRSYIRTRAGKRSNSGAITVASPESRPTVAPPNSPVKTVSDFVAGDPGGSQFFHSLEAFGVTPAPSQYGLGTAELDKIAASISAVEFKKMIAAIDSEVFLQRMRGSGSLPPQWPAIAAALKGESYQSNSIDNSEKPNMNPNLPENTSVTEKPTHPCTSCHIQGGSGGDLGIPDLMNLEALKENPELLSRVAKALKGGFMPPADSPQSKLLESSAIFSSRKNEIIQVSYPNSNR